MCVYVHNDRAFYGLGITGQVAFKFLIIIHITSIVYYASNDPDNAVMPFYQNQPPTSNGCYFNHPLLWATSLYESSIWSGCHWQ